MLNRFKSAIITAFLSAFLLTSFVYPQSLREKVGQMLMVGFYQHDAFMDTLWVDITRRNLGGVILFGSNIVSPGQISGLVSQLQDSAATPLLVATDQEGGLVARLNTSNGFSGSYSAYQLGSVFDSEDSTRQAAAMMAQWLDESGINLNLAPVVDVNVNPLSPAIGLKKRSFSSDPMAVYRHSAWFIDEFNRQNIVTTLKHYPGHGSAEEDSHLGFTDISTTWSDSELVPYQQLINQGYADLIMSGHLYNAHLDSLYPASLSYNTLTRLLKDTLGFTGTVISDEMFMGAIVNNYTFDEAIELAINAGTDILLYRTNRRNGRSLVDAVIDIVEEKVDSGLIAMNRIDDAYQKVMTLKQRVTSLRSPLVERQIPQSIRLTNYPNPFNNTTTIEFELRRASAITLQIFNNSGQLVQMPYRASQPAGTHKFTWNATDAAGNSVASGIYYCRLKAGDQISTLKMILIK